MNIVVVGAGLAGAKAVEELRAQGYADDITLIGAEPHAPYERPPLSKGLLLGTADLPSVFVQPGQWYADQQIELIIGNPATRLDLEAGRVFMGEDHVTFDRLLLATGALPRQLPSLRESGAEVAQLRTLDDALTLRDRLTGNLLIVGGGWIGLEVAAASRLAGGTVTIVEAGAQPLLAVLGPQLAPVFADLHREHGADLRLGTTVASVERAHGRTTVRLSDGHEVAPDLILVAIGAEPDDRLASLAGLATDHGVLVDSTLRASDPRVYAVGDVAQHDHPLHGRIRVEHWDTAIHQAKHAARNLLGADIPYTRQPYFFTDQYDLGMEYVGYVGPAGYDEVIVKGDIESRILTALWTRNGRVVAGMHLNDWGAIDEIRAQIGQDAGNLR
jgi:NADPH-dependent 2,4-dienoyl-CoA reductase/sulfur reductase-like enzyme